MQHLEQLLGTSAIGAEVYRQRLSKVLAEKGPEETEQEIEGRLRREVGNGREWPRYGVGGKERAIEWYAWKFWPHRTKSDRDATFRRLSADDMLSGRNIWRDGRERLIHYIMARDPRLGYQEARLLYTAGANEYPPPQIYKDALELVRRERSADLLMRLSEMNAWETAGRGTPEAYRQVEVLMNRALDAAITTNPRAKERQRFYQTELHFTDARAKEAVRAEFRTEFLLRLCDTPRDRRSPEEQALDKVLESDREAQMRYESLLSQPDFTPERAREKIKAEFKTAVGWRLKQRTAQGGNPDERDIAEAPLYPEYRVKQFVRENRLASVTAAADRLHGVLSPRAGQTPPTGEQIRDAVREACANCSPNEVEELQALYRERWLKGAKGKEPRDLDGEISAKLGDNLELRKQCEALLHSPRGKPNEGTN